jgi:hypothetical protein
MNKLDYIDMTLEGEGTLSSIFHEMGRIEVSDEIERSSPDSNTEMKATTVRLPVELLESYDVILKRFGLTRQDTFAYMVHDFIGTAVSSYASGRVKQMVDSGVVFNDLTIQQVVKDEFESVLDSLPCSDSIKDKVRSISSHSMCQIIGAL